MRPSPCAVVLAHSGACWLVLPHAFPRLLRSCPARPRGTARIVHPLRLPPHAPPLPPPPEPGPPPLRPPACAWTWQLVHVRLDVDEDWSTRFQLLVAQLVTVSLVVVCSASMLSWPSPHLSTSYYDKLYSLALLKAERRAGATAKSDALLAMLDEETEALIASGYLPKGSIRDDAADVDE